MITRCDEMAKFLGRIGINGIISGRRSAENADVHGGYSQLKLIVVLVFADYFIWEDPRGNNRQNK
jgi:hypothetical protein